MKIIIHTNIIDKHDFVLYHKEDGKWYNRNLEFIYIEIGFRKLYQKKRVMQTQKHKLIKKNTRIVKSVMIESISLQHYMKVQVKYLNH